jgi:hypothetical protein
MEQIGKAILAATAPERSTASSCGSAARRELLVNHPPPCVRAGMIHGCCSLMSIAWEEA